MNEEKKILFFDTETTGLPLFKERPEHEGQPDVIQLGMVLSTRNEIFKQSNVLIDPTLVNEKWSIHPKAFEAHKITRKQIIDEGIHTRSALEEFTEVLEDADMYVCHNIDFDVRLLITAACRCKNEKLIELLRRKPSYCTMKSSTNICKLPGGFRGAYKWPKLVELHQHLFKEDFEGAHDALSDVLATRRCYYELTK